MQYFIIINVRFEMQDLL